MKKKFFSSIGEGGGRLIKKSCKKNQKKFAKLIDTLKMNIIRKDHIESKKNLSDKLFFIVKKNVDV